MRVRQNLGDLLNEVQYRQGRVVITKAGKPVAALIDIGLFERIRKMDEAFARMRAELAEAFEEMPEEEVETLVDEAVSKAHADRSGK